MTARRPRIAMPGLRARPREVESQIQQAIIRWRDHNVGLEPELKWLHAIPNGGGRSKAQAGKLKAEGVTKGILDLSLPVLRGPYVGLLIELKKPGLRGHKNAGLTDEQVEYAAHQRANGRLVAIHDDAAEAITTIKHYLALGAAKA
jgi:hypothetical protein